MNMASTINIADTPLQHRHPQAAGSVFRVKTNTDSPPPSISDSFKAEVESLLSDWHSLRSSEIALVSEQLVFARKFLTLWTKARAMDERHAGSCRRHLCSTLKEMVGSNDKSVWSKWCTIGEFSEQLGEFSESIPPRRDSLYELALALKQNKSICRWVASGKLTSQSSVRDVRTLRKPSKANRAIKETSASNDSVSLSVTVFLSHIPSENELKQLASFLQLKHVVDIRASPMLVRAMREGMKGQWKRLEPKLRMTQRTSP